MDFALVWTFIRNHWKLFAWVSSCVLCFFVGRASVHTSFSKTETDKTVTQVNTNTQSSDKTSTNVVQNQDTHDVTVTVKRPNGTTITTETKDTKTHEKTKEVEIRYVDRVQTVTQTVEKTITIEHKVEVPSRPDWVIGAQLGTDFSKVKVNSSAPFVDPLLVGVSVDRRIIGPAYLGAWGMSDTHFKDVSAGIALKIAF